MSTSSSMQLTQPVFICGVGRSGTSLLQSMLNAHPQLCFTPETHFFRRYVARPKLRRGFERLGVRKFSDVLSRDESFARALVSVDKLLQPFSGGRQPLDLTVAYRQLLQIYRQQTGKLYVGDKDPRLIDYLPELYQVFPEAPLIHVVRDPRDVVLSRMKAKWSAGRPWWVHALIYRCQLARGRHHGKRYFRARYLEVSYERLIADPISILEQLCEFLHIPYSPSMLEFSDAARELVHHDEFSWKKETLGPLLATNRDKWRAELTPWQIRWTELVCQDSFTPGGYTASCDRTQLLKWAFGTSLAPIGRWGYPLWLRLRRA